MLGIYFPQALGQRYADFMARHPLRREIIATYLTNAVVNRVGATFVHFLSGETGCTAAEVVSAYTLAREVFGLEAIWTASTRWRIPCPPGCNWTCWRSDATIAQRASRWMLRQRHSGQHTGDLPSRIARYQPAAQALRTHLADWLPPQALGRWQAATAQLVQAGVDASLACEFDGTGTPCTRCSTWWMWPSAAPAACTTQRQRLLCGGRAARH